MNRYKFRGKCIKTGKWIYGSLIQFNNDVSFIFNDTVGASSMSYIGLISVGMEAVDTSTVGQYTGLKDKNVINEMYDGDILDLEEDGLKGLIKWCSERAKFTIEIYGTEEFWNGLYDETRSGLLEVVDFDYYKFDKNYCYFVIGNIHDNPELLKGE